MATLDYMPQARPVAIAAIHLRVWAWVFYVLATLTGIGGLVSLCMLALRTPSPWSLADVLGMALLIAVAAGIAFVLWALGWRCAQTRRAMIRRDPAAAEWGAHVFAAFFFFGLGAILLGLFVVVPLGLEYASNGNWARACLACVPIAPIITLVILAGWTFIRMSQAEHLMFGRE